MRLHPAPRAGAVGGGGHAEKWAAGSLGVGLCAAPRDTCIQRQGDTRRILTCFLLFPPENYRAPSPRYTCGRVERTPASEDLGSSPGPALPATVGDLGGRHFTFPSLTPLTHLPRLLRGLGGRPREVLGGTTLGENHSSPAMGENPRKRFPGFPHVSETFPASLQHVNASYADALSLCTCSRGALGLRFHPLPRSSTRQHWLGGGVGGVTSPE